MAINKVISPHYTTLPQSALDTLTQLVSRFGYTAVLKGVGDILTQDKGPTQEPALSLYLGMAVGAAEDVDRSQTTRG